MVFFFPLLLGLVFVYKGITLHLIPYLSSMTDRERYVEMLMAELGAFERVIASVTMPAYRHPADPKAKTAIQMASTLANSAMHFSSVLEHGEIGGENDIPWKQVQDLNEAGTMLRQGFENAKRLCESMDDATWESKSVMLMNGHPVWESTRGGMAWSLLFDAVHHRGQLTTYLRPMGSKVPSIYGPSADDMGGIEMPA